MSDFSGMGFDFPRRLGQSLSLVNVGSNELGLKEEHIPSRNKLVLDGNNNKICRDGFEDFFFVLWFNLVHCYEIVIRQIVQVSNLAKDGYLGATVAFEGRQRLLCNL